jgi:HK97 family phage prohead protease
MKNKPDFISLADIVVDPKERADLEKACGSKARKIEVHRLNFESVVEGAEEERTITAKITTNDRDRMREIVDSKGADLAQYRKNPILLWAHDYSQLPVGKAVWIKPYESGIVAKFRFGETEFAEDVYQLYKAGILTSFSIGFMVLPDGYDEETKTITKWHLLEVSCVNVPANPEARIVMEDELAKTGIVIHTKSLRDAFHVASHEDEKKKSEIPPAGFKSIEEFLAQTEEFVYSEKPYPNEHACRLSDPDKYDKLRRGTREHEGKTYSVIYGRPKGGGGWEEQAYRYKKSEWTAAEARAHCKSHEGKFEAASTETSVSCPSCGDRFEEAKDKIFDLEGNPSVYDIMEAVRMAAYAAYPGFENEGPGARYISVFVQELYPVDYPDGEVVIAVYDKEKMTRYFLHDYSFAEGKAILGDKPIEVTIGYRRRERSGLSIGNLSMKLHVDTTEFEESIAKLKRDVDELIEKHRRIAGESDPAAPAKDVVTIELADIDAMHISDSATVPKPEAVEVSAEDVRQALREVLASRSTEVDVEGLIQDELDRRRGRMK